MSHTFTRKIHRGEIQKQKNEVEKKKKEEEEIEREEAKKWEAGAKKTTGNDLRMLKMEEKMKNKQKLKELYEKEMEIEKK